MFARISALRPARLAVIGLLLLGVVGMAACGGDDDDDSGGVTGAVVGKTTTSSGNDKASSAGTGSDASYVASICKAQVKFQDSLEKIIKDNKDVTDEAKAVTLLTPPMDQLVKDMKAAKPPADARDYHNKVVETFETAIKQLKDKKNVAVLSELDPGPPPEAVGKRLQAEAAKNADCTKADFDFTT